MKFLSLLLFFPTLLFSQTNPVFVSKANFSINRLESSGDGLFGFEENGKFGYMDQTGKTVIPAIWPFENLTTKTIPSFYKGVTTFKKDGKTGMIDKKGVMIIPFEYETIRIPGSIKNYYPASQKSGSKTSFGLLNAQNKIVIPFEYDDMIMDSNLVCVKKNGYWGAMDLSGKQLVPFEYNSLVAYAKDRVLKAEKGAQYGYIDATGKWLFEKNKNVYTLYGCYQGMIQCKVSGKYGYLDLKGDEAIITKYDNASDFDNSGLARVGFLKTGSSYTYNYGFIDKKGKEVIPVKYEATGLFTNGLVWAKDPETNRYGYMDKTGKWVLKPVYLNAISFDELGGTWAKFTDDKYHYINKTGKDFGTLDSAGSNYMSFSSGGYALQSTADFPYAVIDNTGRIIKKIDDCDGIYNFQEDIGGYKSKSLGLYGFLDLNGNKITPAIYTGFSGFTDGVCRVDKTIDGKTKSGYINTKGEVIVPVQYEGVLPFRNGWGLVKKDGKYYFVDAQGNLKDTPRNYKEMSEFRSGFAIGKMKAAVKDDPDTVYYINTKLKEEFVIYAPEAYQFWEDIAVTNVDDEYQLINREGKIIKGLGDIDFLKFCNEGRLAVRNNKKWGFIDNKGNEIIKPKYDSCDSYKNGYAKIMINGLWGIIDKNGNTVIQPEYKNIVQGDNDVFIYFKDFWGVLDRTGKIIVAPTYYSMTPFSKNRALARLGKTYTILKSPLVK